MSTPQSPRLTAEVFTIPLDGARWIVYAPLRQTAFVANASMVNFLADLREGRPEGRTVTDDPKDPGDPENPEDHEDHEDPEGALIGLLRELGLVDGGAERAPITRFSGEPSPTTVTLFLTTACNLRCTYCYASAGDTKAKFMPLEVATRGITFVANNAKRRGEPGFEVAYHGGGEPTVHWKVMTQSFAYARDLAERMGLELTASAASNGVLDDAQIDWLIGNLNGVNLSFDGLPEAHDRHRLTVQGHGSSGKVMHTMNRFDQAKFAYGVRLTVTADQIAKLPESIEFLCQRFMPERIQVEPAYRLGRGSSAPSAETEGFIEAFRSAELKAASHGRALEFSAARLGTLTNHFCGVTQDSFALSPDGKASGCYEVFSEDNPLAGTFFYGTPEGDGWRFDLSALNRLRAQSVENREYCNGCFARWSCAGDCYHKSIVETGSMEFTGTERCHITRELTKDQIMERIAASGGLIWHDPPE